MNPTSSTRASRTMIGAAMLLSVIAVLGTATAVSALPRPIVAIGAAS